MNERLTPEVAVGPPCWQGEATSVLHFMGPLLDVLSPANVTEVCVNRPGEMHVETDGGWRRLDAPDLTQGRCLALARAIATLSSQHLDEESPLLAATLPGGERVQIAIPPAVGRDGISITVRKPAASVRRLGDFEADGLFGDTATVVTSASADLAPFEHRLVDLLDAGRHADFLRLAVREHQTIVVSGRTGSGKTTLMKGLAEEIDRTERLVTIEDTAELTLPNHRNSVHLFFSKDGQGKARVTAKSLLEASLRMRPDRILLAEVRGDECFSFIRLAASGHPGSITSLHAGSCGLAIEQMALMIRESGAGGGLRLDEIRWLLDVVIDVVVQMDRDARGRFVSEMRYEPRRCRLARWDQREERA